MVGDVKPLGEMGENPLGVCEPEVQFDSTLMAPSESLASDPFLDLAPGRLFFCLNFSSQLMLLTFTWLSEFPTVVAKNRAFSLIILSFNGRPCR